MRPDIRVSVSVDKEGDCGERGAIAEAARYLAPHEQLDINQVTTSGGHVEDWEVVFWLVADIPNVETLQGFVDRMAVLERVESVEQLGN